MVRELAVGEKIKRIDYNRFKYYKTVCLIFIFMVSFFFWRGVNG